MAVAALIASIVALIVAGRVCCIERPLVILAGDPPVGGTRRPFTAALRASWNRLLRPLRRASETGRPKILRSRSRANARCNSAGKGSHTIYVVRNADGQEIGRVALIGHAGDMSWTVTRSVEQALEPIFGEGWMDR